MNTTVTSDRWLRDESINHEGLALEGSARRANSR